VALVASVGRRGGRRPALAGPAEQLLHEIASLDARFEQIVEPSADERARYASDRSTLKTRLAAALAEEQASK
jgi:hypothetical protein